MHTALAVNEIIPVKTVLVVERDPDLQDSICELITSFGYRALAATNCASGIAFLSVPEPRIDCLLLGHVTPHSSSSDSLVTIRRLARALPALIVHDGEDPDISEGPYSSDKVDALDLPFSAYELKQRLHGFLDNP